MVSILGNGSMLPRQCSFKISCARIFLTNRSCTIDIVAEVDTYQDQFLALSNFKPNSYGLLILDIRMSTMNEFELYKKIKEIDNEVEVCFIIAFEDYHEGV
jgi:two-component SAPR family response regulator